MEYVSIYDEYGYFVASFANKELALEAIRNETSERWYLQ